MSIKKAPPIQGACLNLKLEKLTNYFNLSLYFEQLDVIYAGISALLADKTSKNLPY